MASWWMVGMAYEERSAANATTTTGCDGDEFHGYIASCPASFSTVMSNPAFRALLPDLCALRTAHWAFFAGP
jgi:hypothetical protein